MQASGPVGQANRVHHCKQSRPTYFQTDAFTGGFQAIVDTYGIPRYQEVNPAYFAIISFPFLFGVMYGDIGHASLLFLFSIWVLCNEKVRLSVCPQLLFACLN